MLGTTIKVGWFLAFRQLKRASIWSTMLIILVMTLTFLNLVVIGGILVGIIEGSSNAFREKYSGDVLITVLAKKTFIEQTPEILRILDTYPEVERYSARLIGRGTLEGNFKQAVRDPDAVPDEVGAEIVGIDSTAEDALTGLGGTLREGEYLLPGEEGYVLLGSELLRRYTPIEFAGFSTLDDVFVEDTVRLTLEGDGIDENTLVQKDVKVKGVVGGKSGPTDVRVFMHKQELRRLIGRVDANVHEIAVELEDGTNPVVIQSALLTAGVGEWAQVQTWEESQGTFFNDIKVTFSALATVIGTIGLIVASITVFIVIFINAITRRKFIGILKGIGINGRAIQLSYMIQSAFYAFCGATIGMVLLYAFLQPYFDANPIDFPFSDGILVAPLDGTLFRVGLMMLTTIIAGYIPARLIVKRNTLDAILGR